MKFLFHLLLTFILFKSAYAAEPNMAAFESYLKTTMKQWNIPGAVVGVIQNGKVIFLKGYGVRERGKPELIDGNTVFRIGSVSKPFAAGLVATFVDDGKLNWSDTAVQHLPELKSAKQPQLNQISLKDILSNSTGFPRHTYTHLLDQAIPFTKILGLLDKVKPVCKPGQCHSYQNVIFSLSGYMCEKLTGKTYSQLLEERIFGPLGMTDASSCCDDFKATRNKAMPHKEKGECFIPIDYNCRYYDVGPAAGVNASAKDMLKWLQELMSDKPKKLSKAAIGEIFKPTLKTPGNTLRWRRLLKEHRVKGTQYGLGWRLLDYDGHPIFFHGGMVDGYSAAIAIFPQQEVGFVVMTNTSFPFFTKTMVATFADSLFGLEPVDYNAFRVEKKKKTKGKNKHH